MQGVGGLARTRNHYSKLLFKNVSVFDTDAQPKQNPGDPTPLTQHRSLAKWPAKKKAELNNPTMVKCKEMLPSPFSPMMVSEAS